MGSRKKVAEARVGTVFAIKLDDKNFAYGQVVSDGELKAYIIFDYFSNMHPDIDEITEKEIMFFTHIVDVAIEEGNWIVLGNTSVARSLKYPYYKVYTPNGYMIADHDGTILRQASDEEVLNLMFHHSCTPVVIENAVKAKFGIGEWSKYYDKLVYST